MSSNENINVKNALLPTRIVAFFGILLMTYWYTVVINSGVDNTKIGALTVLMIFVAALFVYMLTQDFEDRFGAWWIANMMTKHVAAGGV